MALFPFYLELLFTLVTMCAQNIPSQSEESHIPATNSFVSEQNGAPHIDKDAPGDVLVNDAALEQRNEDQFTNSMIELITK